MLKQKKINHILIYFFKTVYQTNITFTKMLKKTFIKHYKYKPLIIIKIKQTFIRLDKVVYNKKIKHTL